MLAVFTCFLILDKFQDGGQDGNHIWWRPRPPVAPPTIKFISSCREDQRLFIKEKSFRNTETYRKLRGGVPSTPLVPRWGYDFPCTLGFTLIRHDYLGLNFRSHLSLWYRLPGNIRELKQRRRRGQRERQKSNEKVKKGAFWIRPQGNKGFNDWHKGMQLGKTFYTKRSS